MTAALTLPASELSDLRKQLTRIEESVRAQEPLQRILTRSQAMRLSNHESASAFDRWTTKYGIKPCSHGRYSLNSINRALLREEQGK